MDQPLKSPRFAGPQNLLAAISWALLVTVMLGGYALLRLISMGDALTDHEEQFFRAGPVTVTLGCWPPLASSTAVTWDERCSRPGRRSSPGASTSSAC